MHNYYNNILGIQYVIFPNLSSPWYTGAKRRIIDEGMAAGINNLYIGSDHNYCSSNEIMYHPDEELNMVFGAAADDVQTNDYNNDDDEGKRYIILQDTLLIVFNHQYVQRNERCPWRAESLFFNAVERHLRENK